MSTTPLVFALLPLIYLILAASNFDRHFNKPSHAQVYSVLRLRTYLLASSVGLWAIGIIWAVFVNAPAVEGMVGFITLALLVLFPVSAYLSGCKMFTAVKEAKFLASDEGKALMSPDDPIIGLEINGESHAYPIKWMKQPQIVEDIVGGRPVIVTYSDHNKKAVAFSAEVKLHSLRLIFPTHREEEVMLYDSSSKRLIQQDTGEIIYGLNKGGSIPTIPLRIVPWVTWESLHPESKVFYLEPSDLNTMPLHRVINQLRKMVRISRNSIVLHPMARF